MAESLYVIHACQTFVFCQLQFQESYRTLLLICYNLDCLGELLAHISNQETFTRIFLGSFPGGVLPLWPNRGVQSGLKRAKAKIL